MADSLARKLALIADECSYVQKTGRNDFHKYKYATAADVLAKVNEAMAKHGVCSTVEPEVLSEAVDNSNRTVTVKVTLTLHDGDSDQTLSTAGIGCGQDKGDKAVMKAQTAAIKYAWMLALNISTGDDPEADEDTDKRAVKPPATRPATPPKQTPPANTATDQEFDRLGSSPGGSAPRWANTPAGRQVMAMVPALEAAGAKFQLPAADADDAALNGWISSKRSILQARRGS